MGINLTMVYIREDILIMRDFNQSELLKRVRGCW